MRKQGILLKNALGMIIAVIGLIFLGFIVWKLYSYTVNQDSENAKDSLTALMARVDALEDGQSNSFLVRGVEGWQLTGWSRNTPDTPSKCSLESCICMCPIGSATSCQENGFCRPVKDHSVSVGTAHLTSDYLSPTGWKQLESFVAHPISLPSNLVEVFISKNETSLVIVGPPAYFDPTVGGWYPIPAK